MKYWPLIWSGIWRKPGRSVLMLLQILVAFLLFGALQGVKSGVDQAVVAIRADLYWIYPADAGTTLPLGLEQRIASVPGVKHIYPDNFFGAVYQRATQQLLVVATDFDAGWAGDLDVQASPEAIAALARTRTGALVSTLLRDQYHWKVGDQIPLLTGIAQKNGSTRRIVLWVNRFTNLRVSMPDTVLAAGLLLALVLALASASPPAWRVRRLQLAEALAGR